MIKIENLSYKIGKTEILKQINLDINNNEIVVIVGENGSGKTTLLKCISQLTKYDGKITLNNNDISQFKHKERAKEISYLPQNCVRTKIKVQTLIKHGRFPYLNFGEELRHNDYLKIENAIKLTGIEHILHKNISEISGGERQLAYLTMILTQDTDVILLDEPNTFLDISHQLFLLDIIKKMKDNNKTIIIVLHDIIQALDIADKIVVMNNGKLVSYGEPNEVINEIEKIFKVKICKISNLAKEGVQPLYKYTFIQQEEL